MSEHTPQTVAAAILKPGTDEHSASVIVDRAMKQARDGFWFNDRLVIEVADLLRALAAVRRDIDDAIRLLEGVGR